MQQHTAEPVGSRTPTDRVITPTQRRAEIGLQLAQLQRRMPAGWEGWSTQQLINFRADIRISQKHGSMSDLLLAAGRIAAAYGVHESQIDPCHGQTS